MDRFEIGDIVLDGFELVKYLGYEEDEEDCYHILQSLTRGKIYSSAVFGPFQIKDTADYERIVRLWNLNEKTSLAHLDQMYENLKEFCYKIEVPIGFEIFNDIEGVVHILNKNKSEDYYKQFIDKIKIDVYQLNNELYRNMMKEYILSKCK